MGTLFELTWVQVKRHPYHIIHISKSGCSYDGKKKKKTNHGNMKLLQWIWRGESDYREGLPIARILGKTLHTEEGGCKIFHIWGTLWGKEPAESGT